jgi:serine phosphatase RsbU (regulator of sigma subunit)/anti-sigma regulatory factor (Ser/Thr protein kinase)/putative methionine-R-sulfoxide reductase with GAF domain
MDGKTYSTQLTANREGLRKLYDFTADVAVYFDLDEKDKFDIELALEEAVTNIIHHAYKDDEAGIIDITMSYLRNEVVVVIKDWGLPFNGNIPEYDYSKPVSERINGGMGMHFMRSLMDTIKFDPVEGMGTVLTMTKRCSANPPLVRNELQVLEEVGRALSEVYDIDDLMDLIVRKLTQVVDADRGTLYLVDGDQLVSRILQDDDGTLSEIRLKLGQGIAGHVAATGETVNIRSVREDPRFASHVDAKSGYTTRNMICTPMRNADHEVIGVIQLINKKRGHFTSRDESMLKVLASQAAIAFENARLIMAERAKRQLADTLREVAAIINSSLELDIVLQLILEQLERVIEFSNASILLREGEYLVVRASLGIHADQVDRVPVFKAEDSEIYLEMADAREPIIIGDIQGDERWVQLESTTNMHGFLGTPLGTGEDVIGELTVIHDIAYFYTPEHAQILKAFANQASAAIERANLYEQSIQQARLRQELETAYRIQSSFLPENIPQLEGWEVTASWQPALEVGGDFYDFIELDDGRLGILIADVSGKGVPAALFMALTGTIFRTLAHNSELAVDKLMTLVNDSIRENNRARFFVTMFYGILDPKTGIFEAVNAGHNPAMFYHDGDFELIENSGAALGIFGGLDHSKRLLEFKPGDILVLYTDGITEAIDTEDNEYGEDRLQACISKNSAQDARNLAEQINHEVGEFMGEEPPFDDATVVVIKRKG